METSSEKHRVAPEIAVAIHDRRSVRQYQPRPVDRAVLEELFELARWAPSNWNGQPWRFPVLDEPESIAALYEALIERLDAVKRHTEDRALAHFVSHCERYFHVLRDSPVVVGVCYKPMWKRLEGVVAEYFQDETGTQGWNPNLLSTGMAVQNLMLAAHSMGLGTCFHSGPVAFLRGRYQELLGLPPNLELAGLLTIGWPDEAAPAKEPGRKPLTKSLSYARVTR